MGIYKISTFSEYSHDSYQIKVNQAYNNMLVNSLPLHTPTAPGVGSNGQLFCFSEIGHAAYQNNGNEALITSQANILLFYTHSTLGVALQGRIVLFLFFVGLLKVVMLVLNIFSSNWYIQYNTFLNHTNIRIRTEVLHVVYQNKWKEV